MLRSLVLFLAALLAFGVAPAAAQPAAASHPYRAEQVGYANAAAGVRLAGTLTLPPGPGPHPAIVLILGQGPVDRDAAAFGHRFFAVLAGDLTRRGFAVLRSDKRGVGQSSGDFDAATTADFAADTAAAVAFLRTRADIDAGRIGLVGHSEGGAIAPLVASRDPRIAFVTLMAGNGLPGADMLLARLRRVVLRSLPPERSERELALRRAAFRVAAAEADPAAREAAVRKLFLDAKAQYGRAFDVDEVNGLLTPWMRAFLASDPAPALRALRCPVLALVAEKDQAVTADDNQPALEAALAGNPRARVVRMAGLNHFFQTAPTGAFAEVPQIKETLAPAALETIGNWARIQAGL